MTTTTPTHHDMRYAAVPRGVGKLTPWGWLSACVCGWQQPGPLQGTKKQALHAYQGHKS